MDSSKEIAYPGKVIGTEEEFEAGAGTKLEQGHVVALYAGQSGMIGRQMTVKGPQIPKLLREGDLVFGRIEEIFEPVALVQIAPGEGPEARQVPPEGYCVLHAMRIAPRFVEKVRDEVKIGDVIKARVEKLERTEILLTTKDAELGVVKAFCGNDRAPLKFDGQKLTCTKCGRVERRKIAEGYSLVD